MSILIKLGFILVDKDYIFHIWNKILSVIPFNKPYLTGEEIEYLKEAVDLGKISQRKVYKNVNIFSRTV